MSTRESRDLDAAMERLHPEPMNKHWQKCHTRSCGINSLVPFEAERCRHCGGAYDEELHAVERKEAQDHDKTALQAAFDDDANYVDWELWIHSRIDLEETALGQRERRDAVPGSWRSRT